MLLQAACFDNIKSVTTSFTAQQRNCSVPNNSLTTTFTTQQRNCSVPNNSVTTSFTTQQRICSVPNNSVATIFTTQHNYSVPNNSVTRIFTTQQRNCSVPNNSVTTSFAIQQHSFSVPNNSVTTIFTTQQRNFSVLNNSVTTSFTTQQHSCSAPNNKPHCYCPVTAHGHLNTINPPLISLCNKAADVFYRTVMWSNFLRKAQISRLFDDVASMECCRVGSLRALRLNSCLRLSPETCLYRFYAVTSVGILLWIPPHGSLHTADRLQPFVLFNFAVTS